MWEHTYIAIDLKSFYASVECAERGLDPLTTNLVVADVSRTEKTICLAVSPSLKSYGISGRARLFEVIQRVQEVNQLRLQKAPGKRFTGSSWDDNKLKADPSLALDYIAAPPQMEHYMACSAGIYQSYLEFIAPEDIHVYSVDEVFIDATAYLNTYGCTGRDLAMRMVRRVLNQTGVTATVGIGENLYLCKVALDIVAKRIPADKDGVRIAELDERSYRQLLWDHRPLTDFWRIGGGTARKLEDMGIYTMGDLARSSLTNENRLYKIFGVNAELLIDHAWGWEPCTIAAIKAYEPEDNSLSSGQVLAEPYSCEKGKLIVREMTDLLVLDLVNKRLVTDQMVLTVCYDVSNFQDPTRSGAVTNGASRSYYGKKVPKEAHGSVNLGRFTSSTKSITSAVMALYDQIVNPALLVRRMYVVANHVRSEDKREGEEQQLDLFSGDCIAESEQEQKERAVQKTLLSIQKKYGKNAILKGMNFQKGATARERNEQVGGHKK